MPVNPFEVTKAVDFTDGEIATRFVSFSAAEYPLVDPRSPITQYLVGGKGGGRTHLMRYYSYPLQKARAQGKGALLSRLEDEGYVGIYAPASGLDGSRFEGARIEGDAWSSVFAQSLEVRLTLLFLDVLVDIQRTEEPWSPEHLDSFVARLSQLVDGLRAEETTDRLKDVRDALADLQRVVDAAVNNAPLTRNLDVTIRFNAGSLLFGVGTLAQSCLPGLENIKITYMLDELENLTASQQMFVNTLVREKQLPTSFLIGSREWGIRTHMTLSAGEENREGSEFRKVVPETTYSQSEDSYKKFCLDMIKKRLREAGLPDERASRWTDKLEAPRSSPLLDSQLLEAVGEGERYYLRSLQDAVFKSTSDIALAREAVSAVMFDEHPLLEKLTILRAFQAWSKAKVFSPRHFTAARAFIEPLATGEGVSKQLNNFLNLWKHDMAAQIFADHATEQPYSGVDALISMSGHLPRSLLVTLKYITSRAEWRGEGPFSGSDVIPVSTQSAGVREASAWYLNDVRPLGDAGTYCDRAVRRLGSLLRDIRYSDKPTEVSVSTFSSNLEGINEATRDVINDCVKYRMLLEVPGGRQARNQGSVHRKYQLHPMLAPFFGLGFGRRGDLTLSGEEVSALFSPESDEADFRTVAKRKTAPLRAPFTTSNAEQLF
ncbi:hypothetical protein OED01_12280 [Microbacterium sp. M28]|uniref:ORC-CDC6 family AAA ATPase n=1 Tax=Microbacterium sp. M28 TaxID=2962064 RepID=UPI0021F4BC85|nr:hypothetical protein [Microbacterium sp. M28]UYO96374.1 hypothetical protein OED01_12280 [Microbacterium sp. M28]